MVISCTLRILCRETRKGVNLFGPDLQSLGNVSFEGAIIVSVVLFEKGLSVFKGTKKRGYTPLLYIEARKCYLIERVVLVLYKVKYLPALKTEYSRRFC